jgi:peptidyl-prolyl cis-trans isomerase SurA
MRQVEMQMEYVIQQIGSKEKMEEYFNMTSSDIREMYREQLYNKEMADRMKMSIVGDLKISPALVRRYMESLPKDSIPFIPQQVEVQIITMQPKIDQEEIDRVKGELRDYTERVMNGETSFSTLALMYSEDPGSARRGGELGFTGRGQWQPEFSAVAFNLTDPGKVSKIVETEYGFHIIQLIEKRGDKINVRHILRKPEHSNENLKAAILRLDSLVTGIKEGEMVFDDAVGPNPHLEGLLLEDEGQVVGFAYLTFFYACEVAGKVIMIEELFVKEEHRGKGYGQQFMDWLYAAYPDVVRFRLEITPENRAVHLYRRNGFVPLTYGQMVYDR